MSARDHGHSRRHGYAASVPFTDSPVLARALEAVRHEDGGELNDTPFTLAQADPDRLGVAVATVEGVLSAAGDSEDEYSIQSIAKAFVYAMAIAEHGHERVLRTVDVEPSGEAFNVISLEDGTARPDNPMINAGALAVHGLIGGPNADAQGRFERIRATLSSVAGRELAVDEEAYADELQNAHRNLAIAHMLRSLDVLPDEPSDIVDGYTRQCSILVTTQDLALMGATLAGGGRHPLTGSRSSRTTSCATPCR